MSVTSKIYGQFLLKALNKETQIATGTTGLKVALYAGTIPSTAQDSWVYKSDIATIIEVSNTGTGYTTGGTVLTGVTVSYSADTNTIKIDADDVVFSNSTITARYCILYDSLSNVLIGFIDFGADMSSSNGNFAITWDSNGIFTISTT